MSATRISNRTKFVWLLLAALAIGVFFLQRKDDQSSADEHGHASEGPRRLMPAPMEELGAIEIVYGGTLHRFERDAGGKWFHHAHFGQQANDQSHQHQADPALAENIGKIMKGLGVARIERELQRSAPDADYGIAAPEMYLMVYRIKETSPAAKYSIGAVAPDGVSRYVAIDGNPAIMTIANYHATNLVQIINAVSAAPSAGTAPVKP